MFINLKKAYDNVDRAALWKVVRMNRVEGKVAREVKILHKKNKACLRIGKKLGE